MNEFVLPLIGGLFIGVSSSLMLWGLGRITGISGIYSSVLEVGRQNLWKYNFILGLLIGGFTMYLLFPEQFFGYKILGSPYKIILAGLLVGFGTRLGNGCTSGHGVCGISRLAKRSVVATLTFILVGMIVVGLEGLIK